AACSGLSFTLPLAGRVDALRASREARRGGGGAVLRVSRRELFPERPPPLTPPRKGEGNTTEFVACSNSNDQALTHKFTRPVIPSAGIETVLPDALADGRRGEKPDERRGGVRLLRAVMDRAGEHGDVLQLRRKRPDNPDAPDGNELAQLME